MNKFLFILCALFLLLLAGGSSLLLVLFTGNLLMEPRVDQMEASLSWPIALLINLVLLVLFGLQHSIMARQSFKQWIIQWVPEKLERMVYGVVSSLVLIIVVLCWQAIPIVIWDVKVEWARIALYTLFFLGWLLNLAASNLIDGPQLLGLTQLKAYFLGAKIKEDIFKTPILYKMVRHPLYLGLLIAFWAAPLMTLSHLLFSVGMTIYIFIGIHYEEKDLVKRFGERYLRYQKETPKLFPRRSILN